MDPARALRQPGCCKRRHRRSGPGCARRCEATAIRIRTGRSALFVHRKFARPELPELVDLAVPGATDRGWQSNRVPQQQQLQRYRAPSAEEQSWAPQGDEDYYGGVTFPRNDMSQGPYRGGYVPAGNPAAFQVVMRASQ